ncbi:BamA/TamA family outer membrane protein [Arcicella rigui]|uniref:Uncharacterized protein n=1 Tax=Arcicella rigui TaxID=797020 RepID=A0ABU5QGA1_9BACT|nr:hypothetical protein [Arcicella rigui]MEA5141628.1 hypothetical protein [Arcicella rigui]
MKRIRQNYSNSVNHAMKKFFLMCVLLFCSFLSVVKAQDKDSLQQITPAPVSMKSEKDSLIFTNLKQKFSKHKLLRKIHDVLFRDVYNATTAGDEIVQIEDDPFKEYEGKVIRKIYVKRLRVFGETIADTTRKANNLERFVSAFHANTQESIIRKSFLMFNVGDIIDVDRLRDNERLMRQSTILHDARILVIPVPEFPNLVDLLVLTQDIWSLIADGEASSLNNFSLRVRQANFRGWGHSWTNTFFMNTLERPALEYRSNYTIPYIGRSFVTGQAEFEHFRNSSHYALRFSRPFLTPEMKVAGGLLVSKDYNRLMTFRAYDGTTFKQNDSTEFRFPIKSSLVDFWIARAYRVHFLSEEAQSRSRFIIGIRFSDINYQQRPQVSADTNQLFRNQRNYLVGLGFSNRKYKRDVLIYGFGLTEDVPYGYLASFVTGLENSDAFGNRWYAGLKFAKGEYIGKAGYLYGLVNMGAYSNGTTGLSIESNYFSTLHTFRRRTQVRHFVNLRYAFGTNRYTGEFINVNRENGILDVNSDRLWGTKKLGVSYQIVFFSRINFLGFRMAPFFQTDFAFVTPKNEFLLNKLPYTGVGLGIRLRNENLTFSTFQIKFSYFPNLPNVQTLNAAFSDTYNLRLRDFDIAAPEIVPFK